jgi:hypothetical protein
MFRRKLSGPLSSLAPLLLAAVACGGGARGVGQGPSGAGDPPIDEGAFSRPWVLIDRVASGKVIDAVAEGPGGFVAITHLPTPDGKISPRNNIVATSVDGVNWVERAAMPDGHYWSVTHGGGQYVAVGGAASGGGPGLVIASADGVSWTEVARAGSVLRRVRHGPPGFVAVGMNGVALASADGRAWQESTAGQGQLWDVAFGAGRFVAVGLVLAASVDGRQWAQVPCGASLPCMSVTDPSGGQHDVLSLYTALYGNGRFLVSGVSGLLGSADGLTWSRAGDARDLRMAFAGGLFIDLQPLVPSDRLGPVVTVSTSADGMAWQARTTASTARTDDTCLTGRCVVFPAGILLIPPGT